MLKKLIFFTNLFFFSITTILSSEEIIPLKKPIQTKAEKDQKLLIDVMKPLPKPTLKKTVEEIEKKPEEEIRLKAEKNDQKDKKDKKDDKSKPKDDPSKQDISPQQLKNILEAMSKEEKKVQEKVNKKKFKGNPKSNKKDW